MPVFLTAFLLSKLSFHEPSLYLSSDPQGSDPNPNPNPKLMQPCSREMQGISPLSSSLNGVTGGSGGGGAGSGQIGLQELQNGHQITAGQFDHSAAAHDDFFDQMLSSLPSWPDLGNPKSPWELSGKTAEAADGIHYAPYDESVLLASRLSHHQISNGSGGSKPVVVQLSQQQQMLLPGIAARSPAGGAGSDSGLIPLPLSLGSGGSSDSRLLVDRSRDEVDAASFQSPHSAGGDVIYNGFAGGSLQRAAQTPNQQHFHQPQGGTMPVQNYGATAGQTTAAPAAGGGGGGSAPPPRQRVRARRGQATDPHSIAERLRRERIAERMKALQELVPNANKTDKASMLDEIIDYVKFLQLQVKVLSMSRLGGAAAVAPLVADISAEGNAAGPRGGGVGNGDSSNSNSSTSNNNSMAVTEHQVAKLMEEDMGSAMQYLQGKGLCLMPISLASAISSATNASSRSPNPNSLLQQHHLGLGHGGLIHLAGPPNNNAINANNNNSDGPSSPSISVLTVQSTVADATAKEAASVSKS